MKKVFSLVTATITLALISITGCKKDDINAPTQPGALTPVDKSVIAPGETIDLKWSGQASATTKYDVYFGETASPQIYKSACTSQSISVPVAEGHTYYWQIKASDGTLSRVFSFEVKCNFNLEGENAAQSSV